MLAHALLSIIIALCSITKIIYVVDIPSQPMAYPFYQPITNNYHNSSSSACSNPVVSSIQNVSTSVHHIVEHTVQIKYPDIHLPTMPNISDNVMSASMTIKSWLYNNKWSLITAVAIYAYMATFYQLQSINLMLQRPDSWCIWKEITPIGHLALTSSSDLLQQLQLDIHKKYYRSLDIQNTNAVHALFLEDTNTEMTQLNLYLSLYNFYKAIHMQKTLPFKYSPDIIHEHKIRLQFVIDVFIKSYIHQ